jgi:hypothetical protein
MPIRLTPATAGPPLGAGRRRFCPGRRLPVTGQSGLPGLANPEWPEW